MLLKSFVILFSYHFISLSKLFFILVGIKCLCLIPDFFLWILAASWSFLSWSKFWMFYPFVAGCFFFKPLTSRSFHSKRINLLSEKDDYSSDISHTWSRLKLGLINIKSIIKIPWLFGRIEKSVLLLTKNLYVSINSSKGPVFYF